MLASVILKLARLLKIPNVKRLTEQRSAMAVGSYMNVPGDECAVRKLLVHQKWQIPRESWADLYIYDIIYMNK